ncbi:hypothetical protein [Erwinia mallotivora]|uniref:hypothetical protein n=1 Tax=Erwinia mallotivora TaxID=69222 RepID=UPI0021C04435|nr:hypothetical protein [Erwinia mallotivora]
MTEYVYHIANKNIAIMDIKTGGLKSASQLTGVSVARSEGAFATDRNNRFNKEIITRLKTALWHGSKYGYTVEQIKNKQYSFSSIPVDINTDDSVAANTALRAYEQSFYQSFFSPPAGKDLKTPGKDLQKPAEDMLLNNQNHVLCRFAKEFTRLDFAIEERATSNHIYFFKDQYNQVCYRDYTAFHGGEMQSRVLRVKFDSNIIGDLKDDQSDFRAFMTRKSVSPQYIEIYDEEGSPFLPGANQNKWRPITEI